MNKYFIFLSSLFAINSFSQTFNADVFEINYQTGLNAENLFDYQDKILFTGANVYGKHNVIWAYDKTTKKSYPVKEIETGWSSLTVSQFTLLKGKAYFTAVISNNELWVTDATSGGTYKVFEFPTNTYAQKIESFGDNLLAITTGQGLYISDGTAEGTKKVQEITGEIAPGISYRNGYVIFGAKSANSSNQMWASNGVDTFKILDVDTNLPVYIFHDAFGYTVGDKFIFYGVSGDGLKDGLWEFDNASRKAKYIAQSKSLSGGIVLNGKLIYQAWDSQFGGRVWVSDGTSQNTFPLNNQSQFVAAMTNQNFMFRNGNYIYFFPRNQNWNRLWKTDGTVAGTVATNVVIDDTMPDLEKSFPLNNKILIRSSDYTKHWILDANENVTPVNNKFDSSVEEPGRLIFPYSSAKYGNELFQYNFDNNAISIFHDGNHSAGSDPQNFEKTSSGQLIFTATNIESGTEFYGLPNKNSVPSIIKDFDYNGDFSYGIPKGKLFKVGNYYYQKPDNYTKVLARTDGSAANTNMLMFTGNDELDDDTSFANLNDNSLIILTYASDTDVRYLKLWKVDNSSSSINLVTQIPTGSTVHDGKDGVFYNGYIYFTILTPDNRTEIWQTDGTSVNTKKVSFNIADAEYYSNIPQLLAVFDNKLLIAKNYKLYAFDSSTDTIKEVSFPEDNGPFTPQINISSAPKIIDNKLYLLSQTGYGTVYRFNNMQEPPTPILSDNGMSYFSDFQKCGHSVYFATGPMKNRYNAFWSINPDLNSYEAIYLNNYSSTDRIADLTCVNNYMYYTKENSKEIFRTNGSKQSIVSSTITLDNAEPMNSTAAIEKIFTFAGDLYFRATTAESGSELFHIKNELPTFLSVENLDGKSKITVSVSPNPTSGRINIHSLSKITKVEIYDFSGGKLFDAKSDSVDFSHLNSGVYLVKIYTDEFVETKKVIKK